MSGLTQALDRIVSRDDEFATVLSTLYARRHTGMVVLHFFNGRPRKVEFLGVQINLVEGDLDKSEKVVEPT